MDLKPTDDERGVAAIIFLQDVDGKVETSEQARAGWANMSNRERKATLFVYQMMSAPSTLVVLADRTLEVTMRNGRVGRVVRVPPAVQP